MKYKSRSQRALKAVLANQVVAMLYEIDFLARVFSASMHIRYKLRYVLQI